MEKTKVIGFRVTESQLKKMDTLIIHLNKHDCFNAKNTGRRHHRWCTTYQDLLAILINNVNIADQNTKLLLEPKDFFLYFR